MTFESRRAEPGQAFGYTDHDGSQRTLKADSSGVVTPKTEADVAMLDSFGLPHTQKSSRTAAATAARKAKRDAKRVSRETSDAPMVSAEAPAKEG